MTQTDSGEGSPALAEEGLEKSLAADDAAPVHGLAAHRERLLVGISLAAAVALVVGGINGYVNHEVGTPQTVVFWSSLVIFLMVPLVARRTHSIELAAGLMVLGSIGPVFVPAYYQGGLQSPYLIWFVVIPTLAPLFLGQRFAIFSGVVGITCYAVFYMLQVSGALPAPPAEGADFSSFFNLALAAAFGTGVGIATNRSTRRANLDLEILRADVVRKSQDLEESEARKSAILDASLSAIVSCDSETRITEFNPAAERIFGYARSEVIGRRVADVLIPAEMVDSHEEGFGRFLRTGESRILDTVVEVFAKTADGREIPVEILVQRIAFKEEYQFTAYLRDLRQQRLAEATLRRREEELQRAQRLEGVGRLAGGVAHDFNNLLTIIGGYSESISSEVDPDSPVHEEAVEITNAVERAANIIQQLLAFSRRQDLKLGDLDLSQLLRDFETTLGAIIPSHVELVMDLEEAPWHVTADVTQAERITMNLALNACHAMEEPGTLTVGVRYVGVDEADQWRPEYLQPGHYARLEVRDTGSGMDEETLGRAFEPFFTTREVGKGTGLGLATVYGIVRQCGGHIDIQSAVGKGTTVNVYFPRTNMEQASTRTIRSAIAEEGQATVLLVDDESSIRKIMANRLQKQGYLVIEAADGEEAIAAASAEGVRVDVLVSDVVMPRKDGPTVALELIQMFPDVKIVLMSGYADGLKSELDDLVPDAEFLEKPLRMKALTDTVERLLNPPANT